MTFNWTARKNKRFISQQVNTVSVSYLSNTSTKCPTVEVMMQMVITNNNKYKFLCRSSLCINIFIYKRRKIKCLHSHLVKLKAWRHRLIQLPTKMKKNIWSFIIHIYKVLFPIVLDLISIFACLIDFFILKWQLYYIYVAHRNKNTLFWGSNHGKKKSIQIPITATQMCTIANEDVHTKHCMS